MILSVQDLLSIQTRPNRDQISLQTLALFYKEHLCNYQYYYKIKHKQQELRLRFKPGDLCHLLGIHHIMGGSRNTGESGFNKLLTSEITLYTLEKANQGGFNDTLYRILYFPLIYRLIRNPLIVINDLHDRSLIRAQFSFYNNCNEHYIELQVRKETAEKPDFFVPVSFLEMRKPKPRRHVDIIEIKVLDYYDNYTRM